MGVRSLALGALGLALVVGGCQPHEAAITHLQVTVDWSDPIVVDQLTFTVLDGANTVVAPATRPLAAAGPLTSPSTVAILLPDSVVGNAISLRVDGLLGGAMVTSGRADNLSPLPDRGIDVNITLGHVLTAIAIMPTDLSVPIGLAQQLTAQASYSDGTTADVTDFASWTTSDATIVTVRDAAGTKGLITGVAIGSAQITATLDDQSSSAQVTVGAVRLQALSITPNPLVLPLGSGRLLKCTATYSDGSNQDATTSVDWTSTDPNVASIGNAGTGKGQAQSVQTGSTTISATLDGVNASATVAVVVPVLSQIVVEPSAVKVAAGFSHQFFATGIYTDGSSVDLTSAVTWSISDPSKANVSNAMTSHGLVNALAAGPVNVIAQQGSVNGSTSATVTAATLQQLMVTPTNPSTPKGTTTQLTATGIYSDGTTANLSAMVTWSTAPAGVSSISASGMATPLTTGSTTVTASLDSISSGTLLTVTAATLSSIALSPPSPTIADGTSVPLTATGTYSDGTTVDLTAQASWSSDATTVAGVSGGIVVGSAIGSAHITASMGGKSGTTMVTVTAATLQSIAITPPAPNLAAGTQLAFFATATYSDDSTQDVTASVTWLSSTPAVATIANASGSSGQATALSPGTTTISATVSGVTGSTTLTVSPAVLVSLALSPTNPGIPNGFSLTFMATGTFSDGTTQDMSALATWNSSAAAVATVSNATGSVGQARGVGVGQSTISASVGNVSASTLLTVSAAVLTAITVTPANSSLALGTAQQFTATGTYSDNVMRDLTGAVSWSSSAPGVADASNASASQGLVTSVSPGSSTISASLGGVSGSTGVTVTAAVLQSIAITPPDSSIVVGTAQNMTATGTYSDASTQDLTGQVTWVSSMPTYATISNDESSAGRVQGFAAGTTTVSASLGAVTGMTTLTVRMATLTSITVSPMTGAQVAAGLDVPFTAMGTYSNNTMQDLTSLVTWSSTVPSVAQVSNADGSNGVATGVAPGPTEIVATLGSVSGMADLTVLAPQLTSIAISPDAPTVAAQSTTPLTATGTYSDHSTADVTTMATWMSSDPTVATVDTSGVCSGVASGTATISASIGAVQQSVVLTVD